MEEDILDRAFLGKILKKLGFQDRKLNLLHIWDPVLIEHFETATVFKGA